MIFDWGGVLIDDPVPGLLSYCSTALGTTVDRFQEAHARHSFEFQGGFLSEEEFWRRVCGELHVPLPNSPSLWNEAFRQAYSPRGEMFSLAASLKARGFKTAILSNTEEPAVQYFYECNYGMFDMATFSCREKICKPEAGIYRLTLKKLECAPSESLFVDDRAEYVRGAAEEGLHTILCATQRETIKALLSRLEK